MRKIAISIGDLNGVGLEIALKAHENVKKICEPIYCINETMLQWGAALLNTNVPMDFKTIECMDEFFEIIPGVVSEKSGKASFDSFCAAVALAKSKKADGLVTLPINKEAWSRAGIIYKGHTDALEDMMGESAIMAVGCEELFVMLFTHHIPLEKVSRHIKTKLLSKFLIKIGSLKGVNKVGVLGLNPHAGDGGILGYEEKKISKSILRANKHFNKSIFFGPISPDAAFTKKSLENCKYFVCMYHDQGLIPLKALYFEESINITLGLPIVRVSPDHGTAFNIAYKGKDPSVRSYLNAVKKAVEIVENKR